HLATTLFPYTTLFRSFPSNGRELGDVVKEIATRVTGEPDFNHLANSTKRALTGYERLIVHDIPLANTKETSEAAGGEDLLMQQVDRKSTRLNSSHLGI